MGLPLAAGAAKGIGALGGAIIGGVSNIIGGLFGNRSRKRESARQRKWSEDMWNRQNAYNTPAMQMKRLREAGLNPALMYGQGNTGNAEKALPYQQAQMQNVGTELAQSTAAGAQISLTNALANKTRAEEANIKEGTILTKEQSAKTIAERLNIDAQKAKTIQETTNLTTQNDILKFTKEIKKLELLRGQKGTLKGDALGNMLEILNLDPKNNPGDRTLLQTALTAYFGVKIAGEFMRSLPKLPTKINKKYKSSEMNFMNNISK